MAGGSIAAMAIIFQCNPISKAWMFGSPGKCFDECRIFQVIVRFNLATNIMIILLPMPTVWVLHMPLRKKIALLSIFSIGLVQMERSKGVNHPLI